MNVLTDLHHGDLYFSNHSLFEKRLGFDLYRPIGHDWAEQSWWTMHYNGKLDYEYAIQDQFLSVGSGENYAHMGVRTVDDVLFQQRMTHDYEQRCITLEKFKNMHFDLIVPSHPCHYRLWEKLRDRFQPHAKVVHHVGNVDVVGHLDHVIRSTTFNGSSKSEVLVHQELNADIYKLTDIDPSTKNIINVTNGNPFPEIYKAFKESLTDYTFQSYGSSSPDGILSGCGEVAEQMRRANLGWTTKHSGGLGHSNMGWMFSGRPVIANMSRHRSLGECSLKLFEPGVTCIDVDAGSVEDVSKTIVEWMNPDTGQKHGNLARKRFLEVVNYEEEANAVKKFLSNIL